MKRNDLAFLLLRLNLFCFTLSQSTESPPKYVDITQQYETYLQVGQESSKRFILEATKRNFTLMYRAETPLETIPQVLIHLKELTRMINESAQTKNFAKSTKNIKLLLSFFQTTKPTTPDDMDSVNKQIEALNSSQILHPAYLVGVVKYWNPADLYKGWNCMRSKDFKRFQKITPEPQSISLEFEGTTFQIPLGLTVSYPQREIVIDERTSCIPLLEPPHTPSILVFEVALPPPVYFPLSPTLLENYLNSITNFEGYSDFMEMVPLNIYRSTLGKTMNQTESEDVLFQRLMFISSGLRTWSRKSHRSIGFDSEFDFIELLNDKDFDMTVFWTYAEKGGIIPQYKIIGSEISFEFCKYDLVEIVTQITSVFPVINIAIERNFWNDSLNCIQHSAICNSKIGKTFNFYLDTSSDDFHGREEIPFEEWTDINDRVAKLSRHCGPTFLGRTFPQDEMTSTNKLFNNVSINGSFEFSFGIREEILMRCVEMNNCDDAALRRVTHIVWEFSQEFKYYDDADGSQPFEYFVTDFLLYMEKTVLPERDQILREHPFEFEVILSFRPWEFVYEQESVLEAPALCSKKSVSLGPYIEALVNWAAFRGVRLMLGSSIAKADEFNGYPYPEWLYFVKQPNDGNLSETFLQLGSFPASMRFANQTAPQCLNSSEILKSSSTFMTKFPGVTVDFRFEARRLTWEEMEVRLLFSFHRFQKIGIFLSDDAVQDMGTLIGILDNEFFRRLELNGTLWDLYLYIPLNADVEQVRILADLLQRRFPSKLTVFISDREVQYYKFMDGSSRLWIPSTSSDIRARSGIFLGDCLTFASQAQNLSNPLKIPGDAVFAMCVWEVSSSDIKWLSKRNISEFLESVLYMKRFLTKLLLPNVLKIQFVFGANLNHKFVVKDTLRFFGAVKIFAESHNISYFIPGFLTETEYESRRYGGLSWWKVLESNESLRLPLNYAEREAEYLALPTWRPTMPPPIIEDTNYYIIWISVSAVSVTLLILAIFAFLVVRRRLRAVLSNQEVEEFYMGRLPTEGNLDNYATKGFNTVFQLAKSDILFEFDQVLGKGKFGTVFRGQVQNSECAIKIPRNQTPKESFKSLLAEVKILSCLEPHENIVRFIGAYTKEIRMGVIYIVTEICETGSLESYLRGCGKEDCGIVQKLEKFSQEIAAGMEHISTNNIIHGDLSTRNVLLDRHLICKIADFGFSRELDESKLYVKTSGEPIPWKWMAIESLEKLEFTTQSDVWSYGVTLWEIFSLGNIPYPGYDLTTEFVKRLHEGMRMSKPALATDQVFKAISECWNIDPKERPSFTEMKNYFSRLQLADYSTIEWLQSDVTPSKGSA